MTTCPGPMLWFNVDDLDPSLGAIIECARPACGSITITVSFFDDAHTTTDILREGLAT